MTDIDKAVTQAMLAAETALAFKNAHPDKSDADITATVGELTRLALDHAVIMREAREKRETAELLERAALCEECEDGVIPCENCSETDEHTCHLDGVEYGPYACECQDG